MLQQFFLLQTVSRRRLRRNRAAPRESQAAGSNRNVCEYPADTPYYRRRLGDLRIGMSTGAPAIPTLPLPPTGASASAIASEPSIGYSRNSMPFTHPRRQRLTTTFVHLLERESTFGTAPEYRNATPVADHTDGLNDALARNNAKEFVLPPPTPPRKYRAKVRGAGTRY